MKRRRLPHERAVQLLALLAGLPGSLIALLILWTGEYAPKVQWTLTVVIVAVWLGVALGLRERVVFPLQTISNLLAALREGDYSIRGHGARRTDALAEVMREVNALGDTLRGQRLSALEATTLLRKVMEEIDVAVFAFDGEQRLRLVNRAGERLLAQPGERLLGCQADELGLAPSLTGEPTRTVEIAFPGAVGRYELRRQSFREGGLPHELLVITDLSRALREEERQAWQRLIRVIGHEINNSLAPIKSMAGSLENLVLREPRPSDWRDDARRGLSVIASRAEALSRFMNAYARLARLPPLRPQPLEVAHWIRRVASLETRLAVALVPGPEVTIQADGDQLDQVLINLVQNAVDAALETGGGVSVSWKKNDSYLEVLVRDDGPGVPNTANLFVPFFTTKPDGSGIGLVLSRQIAEAHGGSLTLHNRVETRGCEASLRLPLRSPQRFRRVASLR